MSRLPVDLHADRSGPRRGVGGLQDLLDELAADLVARQEDVCLVPGHSALQPHKVKHGKVASLSTQKRIKKVSHHHSIESSGKWLSRCSTDLQRRDLQGVLHQRGRVENDGLGDEGGLDGTGVEQVRVVAHFAELHQDVDHRHEVTAGQRLPGPLHQERREKSIDTSAKYKCSSGNDEDKVEKGWNRALSCESFVQINKR